MDFQLLEVGRSKVRFRIYDGTLLSATKLHYILLTIAYVMVSIALFIYVILALGESEAYLESLAMTEGIIRKRRTSLIRAAFHGS